MLKRILLFSAIMLLGSLKAQHLISGWKAGVNAMNPIITNKYNEKSSFSDRIETAQIGLELEVFKDFPFSDQFFLRTHAGYALRTYNSENNPGNGTFFSSINLIGDFHYQISKGINVYSGINIGGFVNVYHHFKYLVLGDEFTIDGTFHSGNSDLNDKTGISVSNSFNTIDLQWNLGLTIKLDEYWSLDIKHGRSILNINKSWVSTSSKIHLQTISLGILKFIK